MNSELWHACAGPLVYLPQVGSLVYYFPQGHSEQVCIYFSHLIFAHKHEKRNRPFGVGKEASDISAVDLELTYLRPYHKDGYYQSTLVKIHCSITCIV